MAGGNGALQLLVLTFLLASSHIIFFNAFPTLGSRHLIVHETDQDSTASGYMTHKMNTVEEEEAIIEGRMDLETHDYGKTGRNPPKCCH